MAHAAWPLAGCPPNPSLTAASPPPPLPNPSTPATCHLERTWTPTQDTTGGASGHAASSQIKQDGIHNAFLATSRDKGTVRPDKLSSKLLAPHYQRKADNFYFGSTLGKCMKKKLRQPNSHIKNVLITNTTQPNEDSCDKSEGISQDLDITEGKEIKSDIGMTFDAEDLSNTIGVSANKNITSDNHEEIAMDLDLKGGYKNMAVLTTDSNPVYSCAAPASFHNRCCILDSTKCLCQPSERPLAGSDIMVNTTTGFYLDVPSGFTKAHDQLQMEATALSFVTPPGVPIDIPPEFTEAHCQLPPNATTSTETGVSNPEAEKKPLIRLSQNVPRPVKKKIVSGSPAVDEATRKQASSSLVASSSSIGKAGRADEMKITDDKNKNIPSTHNSESVPTAKCSAMLDGRNLVPSFDFETSSGHKSVPIEDIEKMEHRKKRKLQEPSHSLADTTKRTKVNDRMHNRDFEQLSQVFVHLCGTCLSMQINKETPTIRKLMIRAMRRMGIRCFDAYVLYCGKVLDETYLLSKRGIPRDASFVIIPRLRAGRGQFLNAPMEFSEFTKGMKRFYKVINPPKLRISDTNGDPFMIFLSQSARYLVNRMFMCLCRLHDESYSLAGNFGVADFLFLHDCALIHPDVLSRKVDATTSLCIMDFRKLSDIIVSLFKSDLIPGNLPGYVSHLVHELKVFGNVDADKSVLRTCISNHCALVSFRERVRKILEMEMFYYFLHGPVKCSLKAAAGICGAWDCKIVNVPPMLDCYMHNSENGVSRFTESLLDWIEFARNFLSHLDEKNRGGTKRSTVEIGFNEEEADAALVLYCGEKLAEFLMNVARNFKFPEGVDKKLLFGNEMADPDARGGQSRGTEY